jgi:hypothetical protein
MDKPFIIRQIILYLAPALPKENLCDNAEQFASVSMILFGTVVLKNLEISKRPSGSYSVHYPEDYWIFDEDTKIAIERFVIRKAKLFNKNLKNKLKNKKVE